MYSQRKQGVKQGLLSWQPNPKVSLLVSDRRSGHFPTTLFKQQMYSHRPPVYPSVCPSVCSSARPPVMVSNWAAVRRVGALLSWLRPTDLHLRSFGGFLLLLSMVFLSRNTFVSPTGRICAFKRSGRGRSDWFNSCDAQNTCMIVCLQIIHCSILKVDLDMS